LPVARRQSPVARLLFLFFLTACGGGATPDASVDASAPDANRDDAQPADARPLVEAVDPGPPEFPPTIGTLSVSVRTGAGVNDGSNANRMSVCLNATRCFPLDIAEVNDFRRGETDAYAFEGVALARSAVDRVELRSQNGTDAWRPTCLQLAFDGEPVYCETNLPGLFGAGAGENQSWTDPNGLHLACNTCWPAPLTHGPMLGAVEEDRARVWLRTDATRRVALRLSDGGASVPVAWAYPTAARDFTAVLEAGGLSPGRAYAYQIEVDGVAALPAALPLVTSPRAGARGAWSFAFGSCTKHDAQPIFSVIGAGEPDAFLFVGDNHYGNTSDLGALRWHYRWALARPQRAALLARTPTIAVWDDHDYTGNNADGTAAGKRVARRAFSEFWAHRSYGSPSGEGIYHRWDRGDVSFFLLDDRTWRGLDGMLGAEQTEWLLDELEASDAVFKVVASGSQWTREGSDDSWAAFPLARDALFAGLRARGIEGVVLLSGDVHRAELRLILQGTDGGYDLPELTSSPLANDPSPCGADSELLGCFDDDNFFIRVDVDTTKADPTLRAAIVDETGRERMAREFRRSDLEL